MDLLKRLIDLRQRAIEAEPRTANTPALAMLTLQIAEIYLLELAAAEGPESDAARAFEYVRKARDLLHVDETPVAH